MTRAGLVFTVAAGETRDIDISGAYAELVEGAGATATVERIEELDADGVLDAITITSPHELPPWPYLRVAAAGGTVYIGVNYRG